MKTDLISRSELFNKLATVPIKAESVETTTEIFKIINSMQTESIDIAESIVERICDGYCKFPQIVHDDNDLDRICDNCPLDNIASARIESGSDLISRTEAIKALTKFCEIDDYYVGEMYDAELDEMMKDLVKVLHDVEWWQSGDICEDDYRKTVKAFKAKWFDSDRVERLKPIIEREINKVRKELMDMIGGGSE